MRGLRLPTWLARSTRVETAGAQRKNTDPN
jgi:hypothetical protein